MGVKSGIEKTSKIIMPILLFLILGISIYSLTLKHTNTDGTVVTGIDGLKIYLIPDLQNVSIHQIIRTIVDAMILLGLALTEKWSYRQYRLRGRFLLLLAGEFLIFAVAMVLSAGKADMLPQRSRSDSSTYNSAHCCCPEEQHSIGIRRETYLQ